MPVASFTCSMDAMGLQRIRTKPRSSVNLAEASGQRIIIDSEVEKLYSNRQNAGSIRREREFECPRASAVCDTSSESVVRARLAQAVERDLGLGARASARGMSWLPTHTTCAVPSPPISSQRRAASLDARSRVHRPPPAAMIGYYCGRWFVGWPVGHGTNEPSSAHQHCRLGTPASGAHRVCPLVSRGDGLGAGCTWRFWVGGASLCVRPAAALHDDEGAWGGPRPPWPLKVRVQCRA